jgi:hypothetical protein
MPKNLSMQAQVMIEILDEYRSLKKEADKQTPLRDKMPQHFPNPVKQLYDKLGIRASDLE